MPGFLLFLVTFFETRAITSLNEFRFSRQFSNSLATHSPTSNNHPINCSPSTSRRQKLQLFARGETKAAHPSRHCDGWECVPGTREILGLYISELTFRAGQRRDARELPRNAKLRSNAMKAQGLGEMCAIRIGMTDDEDHLGPRICEWVKVHGPR